MGTPKHDFKKDENNFLAEIEKLQNQVVELKVAVNNTHLLNNELSIENTRLKSEVDKLHNLVNEYSDTLARLQNRPKNERGAGRKTKLNENILNEIKKYKELGYTQKDVALWVGLSVGLVNKACKIIYKS